MEYSAKYKRELIECIKLALLADEVPKGLSLLGYDLYNQLYRIAMAELVAEEAV